ncbi:unnamed protein product [Owenia fusiformis]|uniref:Uncharacterized protein n=1 Tax=Owenia fusiformis TaxID=6347 RepID=A0A8J1U7Y0_OWEFU|nr:unnamed protein product [Owenia fusiformis]
MDDTPNSPTNHIRLTGPRFPHNALLKIQQTNSELFFPGFSKHLDSINHTFSPPVTLTGSQSQQSKMSYVSTGTSSPIAAPPMAPGSMMQMMMSPSANVVSHNDSQYGNNDINDYAQTSAYNNMNNEMITSQQSMFPIPTPSQEALRATAYRGMVPCAPRMYPYRMPQMAYNMPPYPTAMAVPYPVQMKRAGSVYQPPPQGSPDLTPLGPGFSPNRHTVSDGTNNTQPSEQNDTPKASNTGTSVPESDNVKQDNETSAKIQESNVEAIGEDEISNLPEENTCTIERSLKEVICLYIEHLVEENEAKTGISQALTPPTPLNFELEAYFQEAERKDIPFPTDKFRNWLECNNMRLEVDVVANKLTNNSGKMPDIGHASSSQSPMKSQEHVENSHDLLDEYRKAYYDSINRKSTKGNNLSVSDATISQDSQSEIEHCEPAQEMNDKPSDTIEKSKVSESDEQTQADEPAQPESVSECINTNGTQEDIATDENNNTVEVGPGNDSIDSNAENSGKGQDITISNDVKKEAPDTPIPIDIKEEIDTSSSKRGTSKRKSNDSDTGVRLTRSKKPKII